MTPSPELERLRVRVRELEEELEEWRRSGFILDVVTDIDKWAAVLKARPQSVQAGMALCGAAGRFVSRDILHSIITENDTTDKHVSVAVCNLRKALREKGLPNVIFSSYGHGYMITPEGARQVRALVEG